MARTGYHITTSTLIAFFKRHKLVYIPQWSSQRDGFGVRKHGYWNASGTEGMMEIRNYYREAKAHERMIQLYDALVSEGFGVAVLENANGEVSERELVVFEYEVTSVREARLAAEAAKRREAARVTAEEKQAKIELTMAAVYAERHVFDERIAALIADLGTITGLAKHAHALAQGNQFEHAEEKAIEAVNALKALVEYNGNAYTLKQSAYHLRVAGERHQLACLLELKDEVPA